MKLQAEEGPKGDVGTDEGVDTSLPSRTMTFWTVFSKVKAGRISEGRCHSWGVLLTADWWDWHSSKEQDPNFCFPFALVMQSGTKAALLFPG